MAQYHNNLGLDGKRGEFLENRGKHGVHVMSLGGFTKRKAATLNRFGAASIAEKVPKS